MRVDTLSQLSTSTTASNGATPPPPAGGKSLIETKGLTQADVPALRERVRAAIIATRHQLQAELARG